MAVQVDPAGGEDEPGDVERPAAFERVRRHRRDGSAGHADVRDRVVAGLRVEHPGFRQHQIMGLRCHGVTIWTAPTRAFVRDDKNGRGFSSVRTIPAASFAGTLFTGMPFTGRPSAGMPFTGAPFIGMSFTRRPFTRRPFTGTP
ncbi:hypothetical protein [Streptosporangium subroseum]|uniref:hypothetical protein n=1 Tax=Streptosporangium subroseum TaxID=106412 RepID=UPI003089B1BE|nr:hypothetical protein OHB15_46680 [Streptosporangium subroseum]